MIELLDYTSIPREIPIDHLKIKRLSIGNRCLVYIGNTPRKIFIEVYNNRIVIPKDYTVVYTGKEYKAIALYNHNLWISAPRLEPLTRDYILSIEGLDRVKLYTIDLNSVHEDNSDKHKEVFLRAKDILPYGSDRFVVELKDRAVVYGYRDNSLIEEEYIDSKHYVLFKGHSVEGLLLDLRNNTARILDIGPRIDVANINAIPIQKKPIDMTTVESTERDILVFAFRLGNDYRVVIAKPRKTMYSSIEFETIHTVEIPSNFRPIVYSKHKHTVIGIYRDRYLAIFRIDEKKPIPITSINRCIDYECYNEQCVFAIDNCIYYTEDFNEWIYICGVTSRISTISIAKNYIIASDSSKSIVFEIPSLSRKYIEVLKGFSPYIDCKSIDSNKVVCTTYNHEVVVLDLAIHRNSSLHIVRSTSDWNILLVDIGSVMGIEVHDYINVNYRIRRIDSRYSFIAIPRSIDIGAITTIKGSLNTINSSLRRDRVALSIGLENVDTALIEDSKYTRIMLKSRIHISSEHYLTRLEVYTANLDGIERISSTRIDRNEVQLDIVTHNNVEKLVLILNPSEYPLKLLKLITPKRYRIPTIQEIIARYLIFREDSGLCIDGDFVKELKMYCSDRVYSTKSRCIEISCQNPLILEIGIDLGFSTLRKTIPLGLVRDNFVNVDVSRDRVLRYRVEALKSFLAIPSTCIELKPRIEFVAKDNKLKITVNTINRCENTPIITMILDSRDIKVYALNPHESKTIEIDIDFNDFMRSDTVMVSVFKPFHREDYRIELDISKLIVLAHRSALNILRAIGWSTSVPQEAIEYR